MTHFQAQFIEKNNDALHASLIILIQECRNQFIKNLFPKAPELEQAAGKLNFISVGSKFRSQLADLMNKLRNTVSDQSRKIPVEFFLLRALVLFDASNRISKWYQIYSKAVKFLVNCNAVVSFLNSDHRNSSHTLEGMVSVLDLMQQGFPSRTQFAELYSMYKKYLPAELARLDARLFCKALFKALNLRDADFKFGLTKVFFRPGKFAEFDQLMKSDPQNLAQLISKVKKWLLWTRWKQAQWANMNLVKNKILYRRRCLINIQRHTRMRLVYKRYAPR
jgi:myosin-6